MSRNQSKTWHLADATMEFSNSSLKQLGDGRPSFFVGCFDNAEVLERPALTVTSQSLGVLSIVSSQGMRAAGLFLSRDYWICRGQEET